MGGHHKRKRQSRCCCGGGDRTINEGVVVKILKTTHQSNGLWILPLRMVGMLTRKATIRGNGNQDAAIN